MADFDDSADPALGAACNRLAAFVVPLPEGAVIDPASGLTESDLALILRALYQRRLNAPDESVADEPSPAPASVPLTRKGPWG